MDVLERDVSEVQGLTIDIVDSNAYIQLEESFYSQAWWVPYRIVEAFLQHISFGRDQLEDLQRVLERSASAYRVVANRFVEITDETQLKAVNDSLRLATPQERAHLLRAMELLGAEEQPDYRNSIKEAISAVEAACRTVSGKSAATLGDAIKRIEGIHPVLADAFRKLYGYTSDESGIRHALSADDRVTHADAMFMLVACPAFISYLKISTAKESGE